MNQFRFMSTFQIKKQLQKDIIAYLCIESLEKIYSMFNNSFVIVDPLNSTDFKNNSLPEPDMINNITTYKVYSNVAFDLYYTVHSNLVNRLYEYYMFFGKDEFKKNYKEILDNTLKYCDLFNANKIGAGIVEDLEKSRRGLLLEFNHRDKDNGVV